MGQVWYLIVLIPYLCLFTYFYQTKPVWIRSPCQANIKLFNRTATCADPESFVRGGPNMITFFFLVDEGIEDPNTAINGPSSTRKRNGI